MVCEVGDKKRSGSESVEFEVFVVTLLLLLLFLFLCCLALGVRRIVYNLQNVGVYDLSLCLGFALHCVASWRGGR